MKKAIIGCAVVLSTAAAMEWPQWRGPQRDGISKESGLLKSWPAGGPPLVWKANGLGEGYASFSVTGERLYTMGQRGDQSFVLALDTNSGKKLWEAQVGGAFRERRGHGPRATPTIDGDRLYAQSADGGLACLDAATGKRIWGFNVVKKFGGQVINWGISESPLIDGDRLIVNPGGNGASIVALNKKDGSLIWKSQSDEAGYSSAIVFDVGKVRHLVAFTGEAAVGLSAANGELLWRYDKVSNRTANIATPIHRNNHVFVSSDYGTGGALLKLTPSGGGVKMDEVYFNRDMKNHYSSSVLVGDYLYGFSSSILTAMKFLTGEVAWRDRSVGKGSVIYAEGNLYCQGEDGTIGLVEATREAYREKSRFQISRGAFPMWTLPVIANGRLYIRDQDTLYSYDIKAR
jgi:outer membrane protein assembly factor BamB